MEPSALGLALERSAYRNTMGLDLYGHTAASERARLPRVRARPMNGKPRTDLIQLITPNGVNL